MGTAVLSLSTNFTIMKYLTIFLSILLFASACQPPGEDTCANDFDQAALLTNIGGSIIVPAYNDLEVKTSELHQKAVSFTNTPSLVQLESLRNAHKEAWLSWQKATIFEFGPAAEAEMRSYFNNFPANIIRIGEALTSGTYDLATPRFEYARGLPTLDYLLYGENQTESDIVAAFTNEANRRQFLLDNCLMLKTKAATVAEAWSPTGANYLNTFTSNTGVSNGKPLSDFVNQWNQSYEFLKNNKLGSPISAKTGYIPLLPDRVEAYYSKLSLPLLSRAVSVHRDVFLGVTPNGVNGVGLDDFIAATGATKGQKPLQDVIETQYKELEDALVVIRSGSSDALQDAITHNTDAVKGAYAAAQNQVVNIKTDLPAALCISITYIDNVDDGD